MTGAIKSGTMIMKSEVRKVASFWSKRINMKVKHEVAKDLGVEVEKAQELIEGKRHIGGETMDKVLQSIDNAKENQTAKELEIMDWYNNTDLKKLRKEFGYGQTELAEKLKVNYSTLNSLEGRYQHIVNVTPLMQTLYDFYKDEFNKKIQTIQNKETKVESKNNNVYEWWKNTDLKALRKEKGYKQQELANILNINVKTLDATESKIHKYVSVTPIMQKLYDFYNNRVLITKPINVDVLSVTNSEESNRVDDEILNWYKNTDIKDLRRAYGYSLMQLANKLEINYKTLNNIEAHGYDYQNPSKILVKLYEFYKDKNNKRIYEYEAMDAETEKNDDIIIKIDKDGNITYLDGGNTIANITEIHLDKVGDEKPNLSITLKRIF